MVRRRRCAVDPPPRRWRCRQARVRRRISNDRAVGEGQHFGVRCRGTAGRPCRTSWRRCERRPAGPTNQSAARRTSPVVWTAPATQPSAWPSATSASAKNSGVWRRPNACVFCEPVRARRSNRRSAAHTGKWVGRRIAHLDAERANRRRGTRAPTDRERRSGSTIRVGGELGHRGTRPLVGRFGKHDSSSASPPRAAERRRESSFRRDARPQGAGDGRMHEARTGRRRIARSRAPDSR